MKPLKKLTIINKIPLDLYPCGAYVIATTETGNILKIINNHLAKNHPNESLIEYEIPPSLVAFCCVRNAVSYMVLPIPENYMESHSKDDLLYLPSVCSIIAHEATHISSHIVNYVHIKFDAENDEPFAYLNGHIARVATNTLLQLLDKLKLKIESK